MYLMVRSLFKVTAEKQQKKPETKQKEFPVILTLSEITKKATLSLSRESNVYYHFSVSAPTNEKLPSKIRKGKKTLPFPSEVRIKKGKFQMKGQVGDSIQGTISWDGSKFRNPEAKTFVVTTTNKKLEVV